MFKKSILAVMIMLTCSFLWVSGNKPMFSGYGDKFEIYDGTSSGKIYSVDKYSFLLFANKTGESCVIDGSDFDLTGFLSKFNAKIVYTEEIEQGTNVYAYSGKIKYCETVNGKSVNLHVFMSNLKTQVKVGSPVIYGGY